MNLTYGHSHDDIALHVNPRLPQNYIVRNSQINGRWGKEEVTSAMPFTLKRGHPFSVQILVTETNYLISVNGLHFALFYHRVPYQRVTCLQVNGDVSDVQVQQLPVHEYPDRTALSHSIDIPVVETVDKSAVGVGSHLVSDSRPRLPSVVMDNKENHSRLCRICRSMGNYYNHSCKEVVCTFLAA